MFTSRACHRTVPRVLRIVIAVTLTGCAGTVPYTGQGPHPQISRGKPNVVIDTIGNVFALPAKIILLNVKMDNHMVSAATEDELVRFIEWPKTRSAGTHFSLNEYNPGLAFSRLVHNRKVAWPYRLLLGLPTTLITDVLLPGRLFAGLIGGDMYNPFTDTVQIYSDLPVVALHETGHVNDFNRKKYKGTYALLRIIPGVDLYQEYKATDAALVYLTEVGERDQEIEGYKILYPAYGTYIGNYMFIPGGPLIGAVLGHIVGRTKAATKTRYYQREDAKHAAESQALDSSTSHAESAPAAARQPTVTPLAEPQSQTPALIATPPAATPQTTEPLVGSSGSATSTTTKRPATSGSQSQ